MKLLLLGTAGCHLCEEAEAIISDCLRTNIGLDIETVDVAEQVQWQEQYAIRIPVLYHPESTKELAWPFNNTDAQAFIKALTDD